MNWKLALAALALGSAFVSATGCSVDATSEDAEGDAEEAETSQQELSAYANKLVGAYTLSAGNFSPPAFHGLVFKADGTYFADVDTGIRCITTPCPSGVRLEGRFTATKNYVRLNPTPGQSHAFYGRYRYTRWTSSNRLTLRRTFNGNNWSNILQKQLSYCQQANECYGQNIIVPACLGSFSCTAENTCKYSCGLPPQSDVYPPDATTLVAKSAGGGFTPPPAPGSTCTIGSMNYKLTVATRKFEWTRCNFIDWQTPMHNVSGVKTLTAAELATVEAAANNVTISHENICGADKPMLRIVVSSPSQGERTYTDNFYSCMQGDHTFVDNIDGVFGAFDDLAH
jgi:hypothetical protein